MKQVFLLAVAILSLSIGVSAEVNDITDIIFTGCPPYVEGSHCADSIFYQVVAVDVETGEKCPRVRYFLVEGPGYVNAETGLWVYHPDHSGYEEFIVEIGATVDGDSTTSANDCSFPVYLSDLSPSISVQSGQHFTVLPFDSIMIPLHALDPDPCDVYAFSCDVSPSFSGYLEYKPETGILKVRPGFLDQDASFLVEITITRGEEPFMVLPVYIDVFQRDPVMLSLDLIRDAASGDTVDVDLTMEGPSVATGQMEFLVSYDQEKVDFIAAVGGDALYADSDGCSWDYFAGRVYPLGYGGPGRKAVRVLMAARSSSSDPAPACYAPEVLPATIATLRFVVRDADSVAEAFCPVRFWWRSCDNNRLFTPTGDTVYYPWAVYDHNGQPVPPEGIPGPSGIDPSCWPDADKDVHRIRRVEYRNGGIHIVPPPPQKHTLRLEKISNQLQGHFADLSVFLDDYDTTLDLGGFDLLVAYDNSALSFQLAFEGDIYTDCGWEYFTYRFGDDGNCGDGCPSGLTRLVGLAETNNGPYHPTCDVGDLPTTLATLRFLVSNDRTLECQFIPVRFFWIVCGNNVLSSTDGSSVLISDHVYDYDYSDPVDNSTFGFPTYLGAQEECLVQVPGHGRPQRRVDFYNGGVDVLCYDIDNRGDINLNGIAYEIADAALFARYFDSGMSVFQYPEGSMSASDVNADGLPMQLADLGLLISIVAGVPCGIPYPSSMQAFSVNLIQNTEQRTITLTAPPDSSGWHLFLMFDGSIDYVNWDSRAVIPTVFRDTSRIRFYDLEFPGGVTVLSYMGDGVIIDAQAMHTSPGECPRPVVVVVDQISDVTADPASNLPTTFCLGQNYPNPFNPSTTISYDLPTASQVRLEVFNIAGQKVRTLMDRRMPAGQHTVAWDSRDDHGARVGSGVYLYRITAGDYERSRKMMLLK